MPRVMRMLQITKQPTVRTVRIYSAITPGSCHSITKCCLSGLQILLAAPFSPS